MRKALLTTTAFFVLAGSAFAADLPNTKGPAVFAPPPPPVFTWTGFYVGANVGLSAGIDDLSWIDPAGATLITARTRSMGVSGGVEGGFLYQFPSSNFVAGVEADFQGSDLKGTWIDNIVPTGALAGEYQLGSQVQWWGTARLRLGYALGTPIGDILPYVTGGFAYGRVENNADAPGVAFDWGSTQTGWTAGAGLEYAITPNLLFKTEYLYTDLGGFNLTVPVASGIRGFVAAALPAVDLQLRTDTTFSTVRVGLDYKFDLWAPPTPVVAKY